MTQKLPNETLNHLFLKEGQSIIVIEKWRIITYTKSLLLVEDL